MTKTQHNTRIYVSLSSFLLFLSLLPLLSLLFPLFFLSCSHLYSYFCHTKQQIRRAGKGGRRRKNDILFESINLPKTTWAFYRLKEKFRSKTNILNLRSFLAGERMKQNKTRKGKKQKYTDNNAHRTAQCKD